MGCRGRAMPHRPKGGHPRSGGRSRWPGARSNGGALRRFVPRPAPAGRQLPSVLPVLRRSAARSPPVRCPISARSPPVSSIAGGRVYHGRGWARSPCRRPRGSPSRAEAVPTTRSGGERPSHPSPDQETRRQACRGNDRQRAPERVQARVRAPAATAWPGGGVGLASPAPPARAPPHPCGAYPLHRAGAPRPARRMAEASPATRIPQAH